MTMDRALFVLRVTAAGVVLTLGAVVMAVVAALTLFRAPRFYREVLLARISRFILAIFGIALEVSFDAPFPKRQTVFVGNHSSTVDMFALCAMGLPNTRFFFRGSWRKAPPLAVIGTIIGNFWTVSQEFTEERRKLFAAAAATLKRTGESVFLSPEGKRVTGGVIGPFNKGAFHLAMDLGAPIVPLFISIPPEVDPGRGYDARPGRIHIRVGAPIETGDWSLATIEAHRDAVRGIYVDWNESRRAG
jgi:1-acyl-sn-glycerol-3-phosphate acyltransferase